MRGNPLTELQKAFSGLESDLQNAQQALVARLADDAYKMAYGMFGKPQPGWPALADWTKRVHQENAGSITSAGLNPSTSMLFVTGELRDSVEKSVGKLESAVGTNDPVMRTQELGGPNPLSANPIPARPVFEPTANQVFSRMRQHVEATVGPVLQDRDLQVRVTYTSPVGTTDIGDTSGS